MYKIIKKLF